MDDAKVAEALRLIGSGMDGVQAAHEIGCPWPTLSAALVARRISIRALKRKRDAENIRALAGAGLTTEQIAARLDLPRRTVVNACRDLGLTVENDKARRQRLRRAQVLDLDAGGAAPLDIATRLNMNPGVVYQIIRDRNDHLAKQVRALYDAGVPIRIVAQRLKLGLADAREALRASYPDAVDREAMAPETQAKLGASISAAWTARKAAAG